MDAVYNNGYAYYPQYPYGSYEQGFAYYPQTMQNVSMPTNQSSLSADEIRNLKNATPRQSALNLAIEEIDVTRSMCNHKDESNRDVTQLVGDGTDDVYCPICGARWDPTPATKEQVAADVRKVISHMQNSKWTGELPINVIREYFKMIPPLEKLADIYEYGAKTFQKMYNQRGFMNANDANLYAQFNSLYGPGAGYGVPMYPYPPQPAGYYPQGQAVAPAPGQPATNVNPMQAPMYGAPGYNPQFGNQANMMMGGTYYNQPQPVQQQPYSPVYGNATTQPQAQAQQSQGQQTTQPATVTTNTKVDL